MIEFEGEQAIAFMEVCTERDILKVQVAGLLAYIEQMRKKPWQPIVKVGNVARWKANAICKWIIETEKTNMNELAVQNFPDADRAQFAQLIGYSISGWGDLSYVKNKDADAAQDRADTQFSNARMDPTHDL